MFRTTMYPSSGADDCVVLSPRVGIVPWLQEGCHKRLAGSLSFVEFVARCLSIEEFVARRITISSMDTLTANRF
jgi:hypothetical protein